MRAEHTRYDVSGWGSGDLWTADRMVLAHELAFARDAGAAFAHAARLARRSRRTPPTPPKGAHGPPERTLTAERARVGDDFAPTSSPSPGAHEPEAMAGPAGSHAHSPATLDPADLVDRFQAFLAGADARLEDVPLDLEWATPFQHAVATTLRSVPRGEVVSYGELASLAGYPGAGRAVGTFCARNRFMLLVPCHRVVGATGLGGYGSAGLRVKRRLLALEGVRL
jgi:O-6-methylguanine DNA methyltransferase